MDEHVAGAVAGDGVLDGRQVLGSHQVRGDPEVARTEPGRLFLGSDPVDDEYGGPGIGQCAGECAAERTGAPGHDGRAAGECIAHQDASIHGSRTRPAVTSASMSRNSYSSSIENAWASGISTPSYRPSSNHDLFSLRAEAARHT